MSLSRGSCRLCRVETKREGRRRRRSRRNDDPSQRQLSWQQKLISSPQPTILFIQSNDNVTENNRKDSTTSSMILCKCLPYSNDDDCGNGSSNEESTTRHSSNADNAILAFDDSVRIVLNNNNSCNNGKIEKMIRSYCDEDQTDCNDDDNNSNNHEWWSLDEADPDPEIVRRVCCYCSSDDRRRRSNRPNSHRHANLNARTSNSNAGLDKTDKKSMPNTNDATVTNNSSTSEYYDEDYDDDDDDDDNMLESPCLRRHRVVIPLFSPSVTVRPLQTLIISVTGSIPSLSVSPYQFALSGKNNDDDNFDHDKPLSTLLQACWKRQLVGKVIAMDDQWTCQIRLYVDNDDDDESSNTVYGMVESYKALTIPTSRSPAGYSRRYQKGKGPTELLSLPNDFYVVLPSTIITIQQNQPQTSTWTMDGPMTKSTTSPTNELPVISTASNTNNWNHGSLRPPSAAAGLLVDTINCVRFGRGDVPRTFLLSGPPGCGKTFAATWAASVHPAATLLCSIRGSELLQVSSTSSSESSNNRNTPARALEWEFQKMVKMISLREQRNETEHIVESTTQSPSALNEKKIDGVVGLIFLDECDALVSVDSVAAMLADLLDRVSSSSSSSKNDQYWSRVMVIGATNRIDAIPSYLRRAGRFDREIPISPPSAKERAIFITSLLTMVQNSNSDDIEITLPPMSRSSTQKATAETIVNKKENDKYEEDSKVGIPTKEEIEEIAELCVGYVAADLSALVRKAWLLSLQEEGGDNIIAYSHLEESRHLVGASALRDASLAAPPKITWDDISGDPGGAKTALRQAIEWPRLKAREFAILGIQPCRGILLHGPPGCAKTTLARAAAGSSGVAFLSLSPAEVYASSYVGEAERIVRQAFNLARSTSPCILFFDEIDSIFGGGGDSGGGVGGNGRGNSSEARVLSTFLNEMDGVDIAGAGKDGVLVLGATNRPWTLDAALMRP